MSMLFLSSVSIVFSLIVFALCRRATLRLQGALLMACALVACSPDGQNKAADADGQKPRFPDLKEVKVEVRADGLAYLPGEQVPFTGDAIELHYDRTPPRLFVRTPHVGGRKSGVKVTYTSGGKLREERTYRDGLPLSSVVYHGNGQKKIEVQLNARDLAEGPYRRWHDNGVLQAESSFDADEHFHGEEKDYDREGRLIGHYRSEHGRLVDVYFETGEMKAERMAKVPAPPAPGGAQPEAGKP